MADALEPCPDSEEPTDVVALRSELDAMRLGALQKRAASEGVSADAVDDAMDGDDPKASLIALIVELASNRGPSERVLSALTTGGEAAADALSGVLDHAMDVLEQLSVSSPRKSRRAVRDVLESVEELSESVDEVWCDGVSRCSSDRLEALASCVMAVQRLAADQAVSDCVSLVSSLLEVLDECGSVAVQCESVLATKSDEAARLDALECVRGLSWDHLESVSASEASLLGLLKDHLSGRHSELSCEERLSCWLALSVLGCRNGVAVVVRVDVLEPAMTALSGAVWSLADAFESDGMHGELRLSLIHI